MQCIPFSDQFHAHQTILSKLNIHITITKKTSHITATATPLRSHHTVKRTERNEAKNILPKCHYNTEVSFQNPFPVLSLLPKTRFCACSPDILELRSYFGNLHYLIFETYK